MAVNPRQPEGAPSNSTLGLRLLLVEDNEDIREALAVVLETEGYEVTATHAAEDALQLLAANRYHMVITDYALPQRTGGWLLREAASRNLLKNAATLVVTAHPNPRDVEGVKIVRKPLDVDDFLAMVYQELAPARAAEIEQEKKRIETSAPRVDSHKVELVLYVSSYSPSSLKATRNMARLLKTYPAGHILFTVHDLSKDPIEPAVEDKVAFTPTLVKRSPGTRAWVLGDLDNIEIVIDLLAHAGIEQRR